MKYRTIVADPPWPIHSHGARDGNSGNWRGRWTRYEPEVPYRTMRIEEIAALPVVDLAEAHCHLYLWAINEFLCEAYAVAESWGFKPSSLLTWCKPPMGLGFGGAYVNTTEFVLFARRGSLVPNNRWPSTWFQFKRSQNHSEKPEGFLDVVEHVSPGPRLELFARRARFGWDYWGDESLGTAEMPSTASTPA